MSEGIDFSDDRARAVVCVGIPFPNVKDSRVAQKKEYNDRFAASNHLLTGKQWFEVQAFRALNQALGRCIRHRNDWGAVIFLDQRFSLDSRYIENLPKWLRSKVKRFRTFADSKAALGTFVANIAQVIKRRVDLQKATDIKSEPPANEGSTEPPKLGDKVIDLSKVIRI